jgi:RNA polymerase sigma-70 factor (ECF subfamily)
MVGEDPGTVEERGRVEEEAGDARTLSFEAIYCSSYSRLVGQLTMVTTSRVEAEDFVQEAFSRLWERWSRMQGYDNVEAWVRRVALNVAIGRWRRFRRHVTFTDGPSLDDPTGSEVAVLLALRQLPPPQRAALFLHHLVGLSVDDVAVELSAKTGTVKSWLHRGRASLEAQLHIQADEVNES